MLEAILFLLQPAVPTTPPVPGPPPVPLVRSAKSDLSGLIRTYPDLSGPPPVPLVRTVRTVRPAGQAPVDAPPTLPHYNRSSKRGPLVTFVRHPGRLIDNIAVCVAPEGLPPISDAPSVVVSRDNIWLATLPADATDDDILRAAGFEGKVRKQGSKVGFEPPAVRLEVSQPARPFLEKRLARLDAKLLDRVPIILKMTPYERAKNTQALDQLSGQRRRLVVSRTKLDRKWQIPGGLENSTGWTSQLFRYLPSPPRTRLGMIPLWNGGYWEYSNGATVYENGRPKKAIQHEEGWTRSYPDGTVFSDILSTAAGPFEVRFAEKRNGQWERYVAWSDASARPAGYRRPTRAECRSCHANGPGTGNYGTALVSGADDIFSDPFPELQ